jgi:hypothetical protein
MAATAPSPAPRVQEDPLPSGARFATPSHPVVTTDTQETPAIARQSREINSTTGQWVRANAIALILFGLAIRVAYANISSALNLPNAWNGGAGIAPQDAMQSQIDGWMLATVFYMVGTCWLSNRSIARLARALPLAALACCGAAYVVWAILAGSRDFGTIGLTAWVSFILAGMAHLFRHGITDLVSNFLDALENVTAAPRDGNNPPTTVAHSKWTDQQSRWFRQITED